MRKLLGIIILLILFASSLSIAQDESSPNVTIIFQSESMSIIIENQVDLRDIQFNVELENGTFRSYTVAEFFSPLRTGTAQPGECYVLFNDDEALATLPMECDPNRRTIYRFEFIFWHNGADQRGVDISKSGRLIARCYNADPVCRFRVDNPTPTPLPPSDTPTPSPTPTPSETPTLTPTPSATASLMPLPTDTPIILTPEASSTPTPTPIITPTPTPTPVSAQVLETGKSVTDMSFSPDNSFLATAHLDGGLCLWRWDPSTPLPSEKMCYEGAHTSVLSISWSHINQQLASVGTDGNLNIWGVTETGNLELLKTLNVPNETLELVRWSPTGNIVAAKSRDRIWYWNAFSGQREGTQTSVNQLLSFEWSPTGDELVTLGTDGGIKRVDASTYRVLDFEQLVPGFTGVDVDWNRSGISVISRSNNDTDRDRLRFYPAGQPTYETLVQNENGLKTTRVSPRNELVAVLHRNGIDIYETKSPYRLVQTIGLANTDVIEIITWSSDGVILAGANSFGDITFWPVNQQVPDRLIKIFERQIANRGISEFALDESASKAVILEINGQLTLWEIQPGSEFINPSSNNLHQNTSSALTWNPNRGSIISTGGEDPRAVIWDWGQESGWSEQSRLGDLGTTTTAMDFSPDGAQLAVGDEDQGRVWVYDWQNSPDRRRFQISEMDSTINDLAWGETDAGILLAAVSENGRLRIWDVGQNGWDTLFKREPKTGISINVLAWSPFRDQRIATGGRDADNGRYILAIWDPACLECYGYEDAIQLLGHTSEIISVDWSKAGWIASLDQTGQIIIWDGNTGVRLATTNVANANQVLWGGVGSDQKLYVSTGSGEMLIFTFSNATR